MSETITAFDKWGNPHQVSKENLIPRTSVYGIIRNDSQILLVTDRETNLLGFPGGAVESDESPAQALARECREEAGIEPSEEEKIQLISLSESIFYCGAPNAIYHASLQIYSVPSWFGVLKEEGNQEDVSRAGWYDLSQLTPDKIFPIFQGIIADL